MKAIRKIFSVFLSFTLILLSCSIALAENINVSSQNISNNVEFLYVSPDKSIVIENGVKFELTQKETSTTSETYIKNYDTDKIDILVVNKQNKTIYSSYTGNTVLISDLLTSCDSMTISEDSPKISPALSKPTSYKISYAALSYEIVF